ncbi:hypothetical protein BGZ47_000923, partial [Haplosporangium gracile]
MWKAAGGLGRQGTIGCGQASQSYLVLWASHPRPGGLQGHQRAFQTGTARVMNNGGNNGANGSGGKMLSDKITIDPQTKLRMEIRKEAMSNNGNGVRLVGNNGNAGDKWARSPDHAARSQDSPYRRAYEEAQNRSFSSRSGSGGGNNNTGSRRQQQQSQDGRRAGRYYDTNNNSKGSAQGQQQQQQQLRPTPPSSFATSSGFGFSAPAPAARSKAPVPPSSFVTSSGFGFGAPKPSVAPATRPAAQQPSPKAPSQPSAQPIAKVEIKKEAAPAPTATTIAKSTPS